MRETEPTVLTQGESVTWRREFCDFPATAWTLEYRFRGPGPGFDVAATEDGNAFEATITPARSSAARPGNYIWQAWATNIADTNVKQLADAGITTVKLGFVNGQTGDMDLRTPARIMLDTLDAALYASGSADVIEYEIATPAGSRRVKRESRESVTSQRKYWAGVVAAEVRREETRRTGKIGRRRDVRFYSS
jgi:hypothetical protein